MYIGKRIKVFTAIVIFTFLMMAVSLLPNKVEAATPWQAGDPKGAYSQYVDGVFYSNGNMCWAQRYENNSAALCFATVGFRVYLGDSKSVYAFVDLALDQNNGNYIADVRKAGAHCSADQDGGDGYFYTLWWIEYTQLQKAVVNKYGATSWQAQYVAPPESGSGTFHVIVDPYMTSSYNNSLRIGSCTVADDLSWVSYTGDAYVDLAAMLEYWGDLTDNYTNEEITASYNKDYYWQVSADTTPYMTYPQTTHHLKKIANTSSYTSSFEDNTYNRSPGSYYTPSWTTTPTGYVREKIDGGYVVTKAADTYAYYRPIVYYINYLPNTATSGSMTYSTHYYDYKTALTANAYKKQFKVSFNAGEGESESDYLIADYAF